MYVVGSGMPDRPPVIMLVAKAFQRPDIPRARQEARSLTDAGFRVAVIAWDREIEYNAREVIDGVDVYSIRTFNLSKFSRAGLIFGGFLFQFLVLLHVVRAIQRIDERPILHVHDINTLLPGFLLRKLRLASALIYDCREVTHAVYSEWLHPLLGAIVYALEEAIVPEVDAVITVNDVIAEHFRKSGRPVSVVYNCPRLSDIPRVTRKEARTILGLPSNAFIVSYVGMIRIGCGLELLVEVAARDGSKEIQYLTVGDGPLSDWLANVVKEKNLQSHFVRLPRVPRQRALLYTIASDATWAVYPESINARTASPWKLFESMACGVPVIVDSGTYQSRIVNRFGCGFILQQHDPQNILRALVRLSRDSIACRRMSEAGRQAAETVFNWENMSRQLIKAYSDSLMIETHSG